MNVYNWVITVCWLIFVVVWITSAFSAKRTLRRSYAGWGARVILIVVVVILFHAQLLPEPASAYVWNGSTNPIVDELSAILAALGVGLAIWARYYLGRNWGMPMAVKESPELVTTGPYARIRHPIYSGMLLLYIGSALIGGVAWVVVLVITGGYFLYSIPREEAIMMTEFPNTYPAYKARTKKLIPFIY